MRADEPASRYFRVEERPFRGWSQIRMWVSILVLAVLEAVTEVGARSGASPARVCIVDAFDTVLYEKRCYVDDLSFCQDLRAIVDSSTVAEVVEMYDLPVALD